MQLKDTCAFAKLLGVKRATLRRYLGEGAIVLHSKDGRKNLYDIDDPKNKAFIAKTLSRQVEEEQPTVGEKKPSNEMSLRQQELALRVQTAAIKKDKLMGNIMPVPLGRRVVFTLVNKLQTTYYKSIDLVITEWAAKLGLNKKDRAKLKTIFIDHLNRSTEFAISETEKEMKEGIEAYKEGRSK